MLVILQGLSCLRSSIFVIIMIRARTMPMSSLWLRVHRHVAASKGCYALAKWLIKKQHVDVNPIDQDGRTPLAVRMWPLQPCDVC